MATAAGDQSAPAAAATAEKEVVAEAEAAAQPGNKKAGSKKIPITDGEKNLQRLRDERLQQKKRLAEIRASTKKAKREVAKLNRKAARVSIEDLIQISMVKFRSLKTSGALDEEEPVSAGGGSSTDPAPEDVLNIVAAHAKKHKKDKTDDE